MENLIYMLPLAFLFLAWKASSDWIWRWVGFGLSRPKWFFAISAVVLVVSAILQNKLGELK